MLEHHGIKGIKWGIRRYQNYDGTLTDTGKKRYDKDIQRKQKRYDKKYQKNFVKAYNSAADRINAELPEFNNFYAKKIKEKIGYNV